MNLGIEAMDIVTNLVRDECDWHHWVWSRVGAFFIYLATFVMTGWMIMTQVVEVICLNHGKIRFIVGNSTTEQ